VSTFSFSSQEAAFLGVRAAHIQEGARELALFGETEPVLSSECGVELPAFEARTILSGGAPQRIALAAQESAQTGRTLSVAQDDLESLSRLEGVVALGSSRARVHLAAVEAAEQQSGLNKLGGFIGLASGAIGLVKSIW
jgi:hypothetical protein